MSKIKYNISPKETNFIVILFFLSIIIFSNGESSIRGKVKFVMENRDIREKIAIVRSKIVKDSTTMSKLNSDDIFLEKYAREELYMSKEGEQIFKIK